MSLKRNMSLQSMIEDFSHSLGDFARWPNVDARRVTIDQDLAILADALRGFNPVIPNAIYLLLISEVIHDVNLREIPQHGLRAAMTKLCDLIDPPKKTQAA